VIMTHEHFAPQALLIYFRGGWGRGCIWRRMLVSGLLCCSNSILY
jgi:hypothetical protein